MASLPRSYWLLMVMGGGEKPVVYNGATSCEFSCVRADHFIPMLTRWSWLSSVDHKPNLKDKSIRGTSWEEEALVGVGGR